MKIQESIITRINRAIHENRLHSISPDILDEKLFELTPEEYKEFLYYAGQLAYANATRNPFTSNIGLEIHDDWSSDPVIPDHEEKREMLVNYLSILNNSGVYVYYKGYRIMMGE